MGNNPLKYVDPSGEVAWLPVAIGAAIFGTANLAAQALNGEINSWGDGLKAFGAGMIAGGALTLGGQLGLGIPVLGGLIKASIGIYAGTTALNVLSGVGNGLLNGDWRTLGQAAQIFLGNFYLDSNRGLLAQAWQGISRHSWEMLQTTAGHGFSQLRNFVGDVDQVAYFGGATFAVNTRANRGGMSIGNFISIWDPNSTVDFLSEPLLMHEYGHTFQSQIWGPLYFNVVAIPSLYTASISRQVPGEEDGVTTHKFRRHERRANRFAARYFDEYFGIDWNQPFLAGTIETYFPRNRR